MFLLTIVVAALALDAAPANPIETSWSVLTEGLQNKSPDRRTEAVQALASIPGDNKAEELAEKALGDEAAGVRMEAASTLAQIKAYAARPKLRDALNDKDVKVVIAAANALYVLKDPKAYDVYYALLTGERKSSVGLLQGQLDTLRDRKQIEKLAFETGIGFVPFGGMGWQAWKTITVDDASPVKAAAAEKLATDPDPRSEQALVSATMDKKWRVRAAAANALGLRGDRKALEKLGDMLYDESDAVRYQAAAAIIRLNESPTRRKAQQRPMSSNSK